MNCDLAANEIVRYFGALVLMPIFRMGFPRKSSGNNVGNFYGKLSVFECLDFRNRWSIGQTMAVYSWVSVLGRQLRSDGKIELQQCSPPCGFYVMVVTDR